MKKGYLAGALACFVLAILLLVLFLRQFRPDEEPVLPPVSVDQSAASSVSASASASVSEAPPEDETPPPPDLEGQRKINSDVYAWIRVPGTMVDYPVLQHKSDDTYYLNHDIHGRQTVGGALFTERAYNGTGFTDPVTIIYGHKLKSGAMFGQLQAVYSDPAGFAANPVIQLWLEDRQLEYRIFAALPYDNRHILYQYDFSNARAFQMFFRNVFATRAMGANFDESLQPVPGEDHVLILSTCLKGDNTKRYLVMAKQVS